MGWQQTVGEGERLKKRNAVVFDIWSMVLDAAKASGMPETQFNEISTIGKYAIEQGVTEPLRAMLMRGMSQLEGEKGSVRPEEIDPVSMMAGILLSALVILAPGEGVRVAEIVGNLMKYSVVFGAVLKKPYVPRMIERLHPMLSDAS